MLETMCKGHIPADANRCDACKNVHICVYTFVCVCVCARALALVRVY